MAGLEPTPELIATAWRCAGRRWTFDHRGPVEIDTDPQLAKLVAAGYIRPHFVSATQQVDGRDDHYRLTDEGVAWLAEHDRR